MLPRWNRRATLKAMGLGPLLLPLLDAEPALAATAPRRLIIVAVPNGVRQEVYWPRGSGSTFTIPTDAQVPADERYSPLAPLIPHQKDVLFLGGLRIQNGRDSNAGRLGGHGSLPFLLTGARGVPGPEIHDAIRMSAGFPSVDQFIARELSRRAPLPFPSLVLGLFDDARKNDRYLSFNGPPLDSQTPNAPTPRVDPRQLYLELFAGAATKDPTLRRLLHDRRSVLDLVGRDLRRLTASLGAEDRQKIEAHHESIRVIERRMSLPASRCAPPAVTLDPKKNYLDQNSAAPFIPEIIRAQIDLTVAAMACDATRVATMLWSDSANVAWVYHWLGDAFTKEARAFGTTSVNGGLRNHHEIAHRNGEPEFKPLMNRVCQWYMEQFAYLIQRMKQTPDASGKSLFDDSALLFVNMQRTGGGHQTDNLPWILAGSCGGYFKTGRSLPWPSGKPGQDVPQNGVLAALCNAMNVSVPHYGGAEYGGELAVLRG